MLLLVLQDSAKPIRKSVLSCDLLQIFETLCLEVCSVRDSLACFIASFRLEGSLFSTYRCLFGAILLPLFSFFLTLLIFDLLLIFALLIDLLRFYLLSLGVLYFPTCLLLSAFFLLESFGSLKLACCTL